jgi:hypothetical protein
MMIDVEDLRRRGREAELRNPNFFKPVQIPISYKGTTFHLAATCVDDLECSGIIDVEAEIAAILDEELKLRNAK